MHIDDFVESTATVTPSGVIESRRLPGSGLVLEWDDYSSEGILN